MTRDDHKQQKNDMLLLNINTALRTAHESAERLQVDDDVFNPRKWAAFRIREALEKAIEAFIEHSQSFDYDLVETNAPDDEPDADPPMSVGSSFDPIKYE